MNTYTRADRVGALIQRVLGEILQQNISDPRLKNSVITGVKLSRDLKHGSVYFSTSGEKKIIKETTKGFKSAHGYFKRILSEQLSLRYMPELRFYYDESYDYGSRIDKIINSLNIEDENA